MNPKPSLFLDHNAGSPLRPEAYEALCTSLRRGSANASSRHKPGQAARAALEEARDRVAARLGGWPEEWLFTGGATEACNLALQGAARAGRPILVGATEHPAVLETAEALLAEGCPGEVLKVAADGRADAAGLKEALVRHPGALVALMLANHETGVLHPVSELSGLVRAAKGWLFCDLAQAAGKLKLDVRDLDADLAAASASKFGGPQGVGLLYVRKGLALKPLLHGGPQERGLRPGTENVAGILAAAAALEAAHAGMAAQTRAWEGASGILVQGLRRTFPAVRVHGEQAPRVANTVFASLPGVDRDLLLLRLDTLGLQASPGAACAAGASLPSPVLQAMGVEPELLASALRFSFGPGQGEPEAREACRLLAQAVEGFRAAGISV